MKPNTIEIDVHLHIQNCNSVLVSETGDRDAAEWLPLAQTYVEKTGPASARVTLPEQLAIEKGLMPVEDLQDPAQRGQPMPYDADQEAARELKALRNRVDRMQRVIADLTAALDGKRCRISDCPLSRARTEQGLRT